MSSDQPAGTALPATISSPPPVDKPINLLGFTPGTVNLVPETFVSEAQTEPSLNPVHVISMIPGIRDVGVWVDQLEFYSRQSALRISAVPVALGRVSSVFFLFRIGARNRELETLAQLLRIRLLYPTAKHSILAHSYGTEMLGRIIHRVPGDYAAIFLCGAVAPSHDAERMLKNTNTLINDCSLRDLWPLVAETINPWSYQATGTHGMRMPGVRNRFHNYRHGDYLSTEHFGQHVAPVLLRGAEIAPKQPRSSWTSHVPPYTRRLVGASILALAAWLVWRRYS